MFRLLSTLLLAAAHVQWAAAAVDGAVTNLATAGSCRAHGCVDFTSSNSCQCNSKCLLHGNCCSDYVSTCAAESQMPAASFGCRAYGCGLFAAYQGCQCDALCVKHKNCCSDYQALCFAPAGNDVKGHPVTRKRYPKYTGFELALAEEYDSPLDLDSDPIWTWSDGGLIEGQIRYVKEAIKFDEGIMKIEVSDKLDVDTQPCSNAEVALIPKKNLTSGEIRTKYNMFRYGRYEVSIKAPQVQPGDDTINGNYVSTMFIFRDAKYKHWRELDVEITGDAEDTLHTNVLSANNTKEWRMEIAEEKDVNVEVNLRSNFHIYAIEWLPDRVTWFFDGKVIREKNESVTSDNETDNETGLPVLPPIPIPELSGKIMMNTWVFNSTALFGGKDIQNNHYPLSTEYGWFRFYKWDGDHHYPCRGMGTKCLTKDDHYLASNNPCDGIAQEGTVYGEAPCVATCHRK